MKKNYYGFKHEVVAEKFKGDLTYIGDFMVRGNLWAVYKNAKPAYELGHKEYMLLCTTHVSGATQEDINTSRFYNGILCLECGEILFSYYQHDYKTCGCANGAMVDGGGAYSRFGAKSLDRIRQIQYDCLEKKIVK